MAERVDCLVRSDPGARPDLGAESKGGVPTTVAPRLMADDDFWPRWAEPGGDATGAGLEVNGRDAEACEALAGGETGAAPGVNGGGT